jgi:dihydroneopterin aldolase
MSDAIFIREAPFPCHIGVTPEERASSQDVVIDVDLGVDLSRAAATDSIKATIDYREIWETIRQCVTSQECNLVETLATRIGWALLDRYRTIEWATMRVTKPAALASRGVGKTGVQLTVRRDVPQGAPHT